MATGVQNTFNKLLNDIEVYLRDDRIRVPFDFLEAKLNLPRKMVAIGGLALLPVYLVIGWGNDFVCNFIGLVFPSYESLTVLSSSDANDHKHFLIYWVVYSVLGCIEYFGHRFFDWLHFYWLIKCIFLLWLMKRGTNIASRFLSKTVPLPEEPKNSE